MSERDTLAGMIAAPFWASVRWLTELPRRKPRRREPRARWIDMDGYYEARQRTGTTVADYQRQMGALKRAIREYEEARQRAEELAL